MSPTIVFFSGVAAVFAAALLAYLKPSNDASPHAELLCLGGFGALLVICAVALPPN